MQCLIVPTRNVCAICKIKQSGKAQKKKTGSEIQRVNKLCTTKQSMIFTEESFKSFILI